MKQCNICKENKPKEIYKRKSGMCPPCLKTYMRERTKHIPYVYFIENLNLRIGNSYKTPDKRIETYLNNAFLINRQDNFSIKLRSEFETRQLARRWLKENFFIIETFDTVEKAINFETSLISLFKPKGNNRHMFSKEIVNSIKEYKSKGLSDIKISKIFNCSNVTIERILSNRVIYLKHLNNNIIE